MGGGWFGSVPTPQHIQYQPSIAGVAARFDCRHDRRVQSILSFMEKERVLNFCFGTFDLFPRRPLSRCSPGGTRYFAFRYPRCNTGGAL